MKLWHLCIPCILSATLFADAPHYTLGYGWSLHESLTLGGCKKRTHPATRDVLIRPPMTFSFGHQKRC